MPACTTAGPGRSRPASGLARRCSTRRRSTRTCSACSTASPARRPSGRERCRPCSDRSPASCWRSPAGSSSPTRRRGGRRHAGLLSRGHLLRLGPPEVLARPAVDDPVAGAGRRVPRRPAHPLAGCRRRDPRVVHAEPREHAGALSGCRRVAAARVRERPLAAAPAVARGVHVRRRRRAGPRRGAQLLRRRRTAGFHLAGGAQFLHRQSRRAPEAATNRFCRTVETPRTSGTMRRGWPSRPPAGRSPRRRSRTTGWAARSTTSAATRGRGSS